MSRAVFDWIAEGGFTLRPDDESPIDQPRPRQNARAQAEVDRSLRKQISERTVRLWDRSREGDPTFVTPVFAVPKKSDEEVFRLIGDFRLGNERLRPWRVRLGLGHH
jgi:hypothetical protein